MSFLGWQSVDSSLENQCLSQTSAGHALLLLQFAPAWFLQENVLFIFEGTRVKSNKIKVSTYNLSPMIWWVVSFFSAQNCWCLKWAGCSLTFISSSHLCCCMWASVLWWEMLLYLFSHSFQPPSSPLRPGRFFWCLAPFASDLSLSDWFSLKTRYNGAGVSKSYLADILL